MIIIDKVRFKNLQAVGNYWVTVDISKYKNIVIYGKNGHGKSTVLSALSFVAYGKPFTKIKIGELVNTFNKHLETELYFRKGNDSYKIRRGLKPDFFEIYKNEELIPQNGNKEDYQKELNKIFGFDYKSFVRSILIGSAIYEPFMQLDAKERRLFIDKFFDLEVLTVMSDAIKKDIKDYKSDIKEIEDKIYKLEVQIETKTKSLSDDSTEDQKKINEFNEKIKKILEEIVQLEKERGGYEEKIANVEISKYKTNLSDLKTKLNKLNNDLSNINLVNKQNQKKIDSLAERTICPECKQEISDEVKQSLINEYVMKDDSEFKESKSKIEERITKLEDFFIKYDGFVREIDRINNSIKNFNREIGIYTAEITSITEKKKTNVEDEIAQLKETLNKETEKKEKKVKELKLSEVSSIFLKDDGIKASIIKRYLPVINDNINKYLELFNFFLRFELNEEFEETLKSRHVENRSYFSFSEGQKRRIDIAILFAFKDIAKSKNIVNCNLLAFDETLERVDADGAEAFVKLLKSQSTTNIIISHSEDIINKFQGTDDCSIKAVMKNNFSYYEIT